MNKPVEGVLYPFRMSGAKLRQSAVQLRRQGQALDALSLIRRAAEQEDTPHAWMALAAELRQLGCWEAAAQMMGRVLSAPEPPAGAWMEMARNLHALGQYPLALDCVYHQLHEDPWGADGDAARTMLLSLEDGTDDKEPKRTAHLVQRGLNAWNAGDRYTGERKIRRALKLVRDKERLLSTAAMMCMLQNDAEGALRYLTRSLRRNGQDARTMIALSTLLYQLGKVRIARGFLQKAAPLCQGVMAEDAFLTAAWAQDAWGQMEDFLRLTMKRTPHRIPLLAAKATLMNENGETPAAIALWKEILAIDPDDRAAASQMAAQKSGESTRLLPPMTIPLSQRRAQTRTLRMLLESGVSLKALLIPGSEGRRLIDWHMTAADPAENRIAQAIFEKDESCAVPYLRTLVSRPMLKMETRQWALIRLAEMGCLDEMLLPTGEHYNTVQCQKIGDRKEQSPWRMFLMSLLIETRRYRESSDMAEFAASVWGCMSHEYRMQAAGSGRYVWCKAMEIMYLRITGREARAIRAVEQSAVTKRKISRVIRRLASCLELNDL